MATPPIIACVDIVSGALYFVDLIFVDLPVNCENRKNWLPQKFPAMRHDLKWLDTVYGTRYNM